MQKINKLNASRIALLNKYKKTNRQAFFLKSCDYAKEILKINPNYKLTS